MIIQFEISRSFSKKVQVAQYEPEEYFCGVKAILDTMPSKEEQNKIALELDTFCREEVARSQKVSQEEQAGNADFGV